MNKETAVKLKLKAEEVAKNFSNDERKYNNNDEEFKINDIISLGDDLAIVIYLKSSGKKALAVFIHVRAMGYWTYFFPTSSHLIGLDKIKDFYLQIERENFKFNFNQEIQYLSEVI